MAAGLNVQNSSGKLDNTSVSEVPVIPEEVKDLIKVIGIVNKDISWNIHKSKRNISLTLVYPRKSPASQQTARPSNANVVQSSSPKHSRSKSAGPKKENTSTELPPKMISKQAKKNEHSTSTLCAGAAETIVEKRPVGKKGKTPSRLRRDRKRLLKFRADKAKKKKDINPPQSTSRTTCLKAAHPLFRHTHFQNPEHAYSQSVKLHGGKIVILQDGKPSSFGNPPPLKIDVSINSSILDLKKTMCNTICNELNFPGDLHPSNLKIVHIGAPLATITSNPDPSLFTLDIPDLLPVSTWLLDKRRPHFDFIYDIDMSRDVA